MENIKLLMGVASLQLQQQRFKYLNYRETLQRNNFEHQFLAISGTISNSQWKLCAQFLPNTRKRRITRIGGYYFLIK